MLPEYKIKVGEGIGPIRFGMSRDEVKDLLGAPEEITENTDVEGEVDFTWYFDDSELILCFDEEDDYKLSLIEIDNENVELFDQKLFDLTLENTKKLFQDNKITDGEQENLEDEFLLSSRSLGVDLYFDEEQLLSAQLSPLFIDDDTIKWPE